MVKFFILALLFVQSSVFADDFNSTLNQEVYRKAYPLSVKFCSFTRVHRKGEVPGGPFAHAVLYFDNACIDTNYSYPQLRKCNPGEPQGTGISVNKYFKNVNWVALPGRELFFYGNLKDSDVLDNNARENLVADVMKLNIFQGIQVKDKFLNEIPEDMGPVKFLINKSIATDFAVNWGRDVYCANVPMTETLLDKGLEFVNLANMIYGDPVRFQSYQLKSLKSSDLKAINLYSQKAKESGEARDYSWDAISQNCVHLAYNLFAAMGLVLPKRIGIKVPNHITMAVPADRWMSLLNTANDRWSNALDEIWKIWVSTRDLAVLEDEAVVVKHHGVLAEHIPMHAEERNELFIRHTEHLGLWPAHKKLIKKYSVERPAEIYDIETNLKRFDQVYTQALSQPMDPSGLPAEKRKFLQSPANMNSFMKLVRQFRAALETAQSRVRAHMVEIHQ